MSGASPDAWRGRVVDAVPPILRPDPDGAPTEPIDAMISAMAELLASLDAGVAAAPECIDPRKAPERFLPMLALWMDLAWLLEHGATGERRLRSGTGRLRELIALRAHHLRLRGARAPLEETVRLATGLDEIEIIEDPDAPFSFSLRAPPLDPTTRARIVQIVAREKPAYVAWSIDETASPHPTVAD